MNARTAVFLLCLPGCAAHPHRPGETEDYGYYQGTKQVWVRGPWESIKPSPDVDDVIDQLCPALMELPGARDKDYGREYCGALYSLGDGIYYASKPSPLTEPTASFQSKKKTCGAPREVRDARMNSPLSPPILADYHSHPWTPSEMSGNDLKAKNSLWLIRIQFDTACHIQKLIPHTHDTKPGELYERRGKTWKLIAIIEIEDKSTGRLTRITE
jgi:hypothetical protein